MLNYIVCTLKSNDNHIDSPHGTVRLDSLDDDYPYIVNVAGKKMHLLGVSLVKEKDVRIKVCNAETSRIHSLLLETDDMENLEMTAAFINHTLVEIGETNLYTLLVVYSCNNSRQIYPSTLKGLDDSEAWVKLMGLKNHEVRVFQMKGPKMRFMDFSQFIIQMNEDGMGGYYAIELHLKEKYL